MQIDPISLESPAMNERIMKMSDMKLDQSEMESEYDFKNGERGKYARHDAEETNIVVLAPDRDCLPFSNLGICQRCLEKAS